MAYNAQFDLRGKRIQDTYTQVLQYDSSSGVAYTGQGGSLNISSSFAATASFASTAAFANNATSASYAPPQSVESASYAPVEPDYSASVSSAKQNALVAGNTYAITSSWAGNTVSASYATNASRSNHVVITDIGNGDTEHPVVFQSATSINTLVMNGGGTSLFSFNPGTNTLKAGTFLGNLTGTATNAVSASNADTASSLSNGTLMTVDNNITGANTITATNLVALSGITGDGTNITGIVNAISSSLSDTSVSSSYSEKATTAIGVQGEPNTNVTVTSVGSGQMNIWGNGMTQTSVAGYSLAANGDINLSSSFQAIKLTAPTSLNITSSGIHIAPNDPTSQDAYLYMWSWEGNTFHTMSVNDAGFAFGSVGVTNLGAATTITAQGNISSTFGSISASTGFKGHLHDTASWADNAVSASWSPGDGSGTLLTTGSTYDITSSWAVNVVNGANQVSVSWASRSLSASVADKLIGGGTVTGILSYVDGDGFIYNTRAIPGGVVFYASSWGGTSITMSSDGVHGDLIGNVIGNADTATSASWASASISASYASQSFYASTANFADSTDFATNASLAQNALVAEEASSSISSSWASASMSASYSDYSEFALESDISSVATSATSASWASASFVATSASFASQSISSSYAVTASYAANAAGTVLTTGSTYQITASWAVNVVNGGGGTISTQSSYDISMKDMQFPFTAAFAGITPALLSGYSFDNNTFNRLGNGAVNGLVFWYLQFRNENIAGGNEAVNGITASLSFHQMRAPVNFSNAGGVTHSFQYFAMGTTDNVYTPIEGEIPGANDRVYWNVDLYSLTSSTAAAANFFSAPTLVGRNIVTQSFNGAIHESGSMETVTSIFSGSSLTNDCMFFINVKRINSDSSSIYDPGTPVGDRTDYTGSVAMVSSRISFNTM